MEHNNIQESNYQSFIKYIDPEEKLGNKDKSALHLAYLIKTIVDKGIRVNFTYHTFVHGEEGDSDSTFKQNRKGAIYFSVYDQDFPKGIEIDKTQLHYDTTQLAFVSLRYTKLLNYINKMVLTKYPSDKEWDKEMDSRGKFNDKLSELKYEDFIDGKLVQRDHSRITPENFNDFLNILLTDKLITEFDKIIQPENYKKDKFGECFIKSRFKL